MCLFFEFGEFFERQREPCLLFLVVMVDTDDTQRQGLNSNFFFGVTIFTPKGQNTIFSVNIFYTEKRLSVSMLPVFSVKIYNKNNKERSMHSSNHTLLPELEPTVITEVGALITTPCYLTYTHSTVITEVGLVIW